jgi:hypothetical protein
VRDIVMVIADLYLPAAADGAQQAAAAFTDIPGLQSVARFGERRALHSGWRAWLAGRLGRTDLTDVAPACVAGALLEGAPESPAAAATRWIASPVQLSAGLTRVHLDHRGLLSLSPEQLAVLAADFARTFGASGFSLAPLPSGDFLLSTPGILPLRTPEPARCAGGLVSEVVPASAAAAPLRRLLAEIEMWLHGHAVNEARAQRGEPPVTTLWVWGAEGRVAPLRRLPREGLPQAFGRDAWLAGLWHLLGGACSGFPAHLAEVLRPGNGRAVLVAQTGGQLRENDHATHAQALARLDEHFVCEALRALRHGQLAGLTVILNDTRVSVGRASRLKLWRRRTHGLKGFA